MRMNRTKSQLWQGLVMFWPHMMTSSNGNIFRVTGHLCGEFTGEFPTQRPVTRSFDAFFDLRLNKQLNKQSWGCWFETLSRLLWRHRNEQINAEINWPPLLQTPTLRCISWMRRFAFRLKFHESLLLSVKFTISQRGFRYWFCAK